MGNPEPPGTRERMSESATLRGSQVHTEEGVQSVPRASGDAEVPGSGGRGLALCYRASLITKASSARGNQN